MKLANKYTKRVAALLLLMTAALQAASAEHAYDVTILEQHTIHRSPYTNRMLVGVGTSRYDLLLQRSQAFRQLTTHGEIAGNKPPRPVHSYQGKVKDLENSWVRITTAGDYLSGVIDTGTERLFVTSEPMPARPFNQRRIQRNLHAIDYAIKPPPEKPADRVRNTRDVIQINVDNNSLGGDLVTRVARIAIVIDTLYDEALGGRGLAKAISTINTVDGLYQQEFGLALKVETAIIITDTETLDLGNKSLEENLARFRDYRLAATELDSELGLVHLFTGVTTTDPSVGLAYIGAACRDDGYDVSMSTPFDFPVLLTAHEIGHNLGALHDDETELCTLTTDHLMFSHISSLSTREFSTCSIEAINKRLAQSACHLNAIDLSLTLSRTSDSSAVALITNTDTQRPADSAKLNLELGNANVASAPANCEIDNKTTSISCDIPTIYPGDSETLEITFRFDSAIESTINASLEAVGFIDINSINNEAQIVVAAQTEEEPTSPAVNNDENTTTGSADPLPVNTASADSGGGSTGLVEIFLLIAGLRYSTSRRGISQRSKHGSRITA